MVVTSDFVQLVRVEKVGEVGISARPRLIRARVFQLRRSKTLTHVICLEDYFHPAWRFIKKSKVTLNNIIPKK